MDVNFLRLVIYYICVFLHSIAREREMMMQDITDNECSTLIQVFSAELLGTAFMMFFGCMGVFVNSSAYANLPQFQSGLVFGFIVSSVIVAIGHISKAHLNPSVTLSAYLLGNITIIAAFIYFIAECCGAVIGFWLLKKFTPVELFEAYENKSCGFCNTVLSPNVSINQGFVIEFLLTSFLIFLVCSVWDSRNARNADSAAIKFGLFITAASISAGPFTGAGMNPVRSFAPAFINNVWNHHWIYWLAPLSGSATATSIYKILFLRRQRSEEFNNGQRWKNLDESFPAF